MHFYQLVQSQHDFQLWENLIQSAVRNHEFAILDLLHCELSKGLKLPAWINAKSHAFVWPFTVVCFQMSPQIACMNPCWLHLIFLHYVFSNVSSLWEYFDLQGPWQKVLTDLKKSLYTLQADPEKSRDFIFQNPGILINWKSRDSRNPARAWSGVGGRGSWVRGSGGSGSLGGRPRSRGPTGP